MKSDHDIEQLLQKHKLKVTDCRIAILSSFKKSHYALTHAEVEAGLKDYFDRVTIYRNLNSFLEKGLIHKVPDDAGAAKFALCENCGIDDHYDSHIHFKCVKCQLTQCIDDVQIPLVKLPPGYSLLKTTYLVEGVCNKCR